MRRSRRPERWPPRRRADECRAQDAVLRGQAILFLGADDLGPDALETLLGALEGDPEAGVRTRAANEPASLASMPSFIMCSACGAIMEMLRSTQFGLMAGRSKDSITVGSLVRRCST